MLIDTHFHLTDEKYTSKELILMNSIREGISKLVTIGTCLADDKEVVELIEKYPELYGVIGIYPHEDKNLKVEEIEKELRTLLSKSKKIVGIGECGIDIVESTNNEQHNRPIDKQIEIFEMQVKLAIENNLPLVIHNRNGDKIVLDILNKYKTIANTSNKKLRGVIHCFASSWEIAQKFIELGFYISFSGIITYPSGKSLHETVANIPMDKFVLETDAPWLTPQGHRGKINEPKYVRMTAQKVSEIKGLSESIINSAAYKNSCDLFGLPCEVDKDDDTKTRKENL